MLCCACAATVQCVPLFGFGLVLVQQKCGDTESLSAAFDTRRLLKVAGAGKKAFC